MTPSPPVAIPADESSHFTNVLIRASAGTGKTYQLAKRYVKLLRRYAPDRILATTFTRKAAGEILERILKMLAEEPEPSDEPYAALQEFTRRLHRVHIGTIDSFFIKIGSAIALELGLPAGWRIIDEHEQAHLRLQAIEALLQTESTTDVVRLMHLLSQGESRQAVATQLLQAVERFHILYKTTDRAAWERLIAPPFLASRELNEALTAFATVTDTGFERVEKAHAESLANAQANHWEIFLSKGLARNIIEGKDKYYTHKIPAAHVAVYCPLIQHAQAFLIKQLAERNEATWQLLQRYDAAWNEIARDERGQTFLHVALRLGDHFAQLKSSQPESAPQSASLDRVAFRIDSQVDQLLLDEFQDTSITQWNALSMLAAHVATSEEGGFFCVGDEKQSIYGWRGGRPELFAHLNQRVEGLVTQELNESWRSAQSVIDTVNEVFQNLLRHPDLDPHEREAVDEFSHAFPQHRTTKDFAGYCELKAAASGENETPGIAVNQSIASLVKEIQQKAAGCTIGILLRTNDEVGSLVNILREQGIDASEEGGTPITDSAAVQIILSALTMADHPGDTVARFHVATSPLGSTLGFTEYQNNDAACRVAAAIRERLLNHGYARTLSEWIAWVAAWCNAREAGRLRQLVELADEFQPLASLRTSDFIRFVEKEKMESPSSSPVRVMTIHQAKGLQFDVVILGELETRLTSATRPGYVTSEPDPFAGPDGMCLYVDAKYQDSLPPHARQMFRSSAHREVREALCLLYVAMTRAVRALYMICPPPNAEEKKQPRTYAGVLSAAMLGRSLAADDIVSRGDPRWLECLPAELRQRRSLPRAPANNPVLFASGGDDQVRARDRLSPSRKTLVGRIRISQALKTAVRETLDRASLIHAWFESVEWLDDGRPSRQSLQAVADELGMSNADAAACLPQFQAMLNRPDVAFALSRTSYSPPASMLFDPGLRAELEAEPLRLEVERERRFVIREKNAIVAGAIDRLVLMYRGEKLLAADILDFKTDSPTIGLAERESRHEHYQTQLACYARAVAGIYQLAEHRISTRLVMVSSGRVEAVEWRREPITPSD